MGAITAAAGATVNVLGTGVLDNWVGLYFNGGGASTATNSGSINGQSTGIFSTSGRVNFTNNVGGTVSTSGASGAVQARKRRYQFAGFPRARHPMAAP